MTELRWRAYHDPDGITRIPTDEAKQVLAELAQAIAERERQRVDRDVQKLRADHNGKLVCEKQAEVERLREALRRYGVHLTGCESLRTGKARDCYCDCGLAAALADEEPAWRVAYRSDIADDEKEG